MAGPDDLEGEVPEQDVVFPQAVAGALWANPDVYPSVPLRIQVEGSVDAVAVELTERTYLAERTDFGSEWVAELPLSTLADGFYSVRATASIGGVVRGTAAVELGVGRQGVALTNFSNAKHAHTPRIHWHQGKLWLTWSDRSAGPSTAWLQELDGAGRFVGERTTLVSSPREVLAARAAIGLNSIGVLYQEPGGPYENYFTVVGLDGAERVAPIALDGGSYGSLGNDIVFDGDGWVITWRINDGAANSKVLWARIDEATGAMMGPVTVASAGSEEPHGGFQPMMTLSVATVDEVSLVTYVRERYDSTLELSVPKSQVAVVKRDGTVLSQEFFGPESDWTFHREAAVFRNKGELIALWTLSELTNPDPNPPQLIYGTRTGDGVLDPARGSGTLVLSPPGNVDEPYLIDHPELQGVLAWTDGREYIDDLAFGQTELWVAPLSDDLAVRDAEAKYFEHTRFFPNTGMPRGTTAGSNVLLVWIDERHGSGVLAPRPEAWFETAWF